MSKIFFYLAQLTRAESGSLTDKDMCNIMGYSETYLKYLHGIDGSRVLAGDLAHLEYFAVTTLAEHLAQFKVLWTRLLFVLVDHMLRQQNSFVVIRTEKSV